MTEMGFCVTGGDGIYGKLARFCVRSIRIQYPNAPIVVCIPADERQSVPLPSDVIVRSIELPLEDYGFITKVCTLTRAERELDVRPLCLLDSDVLVTDQLSIPPSGYEFAAKPADCGWEWGIGRESTWEYLYDEFGLSLPEASIRSTTGGKGIWPFYNAGVVVSNVPRFGERWLELTAALRSEEGEIGETIYADQMALGMLSTEYDVLALEERQNYPLGLRYIVPGGLEVIHYHDPRNLLKAPRYRGLLQEVGILEYLPFTWSDPRILPWAMKHLYRTSWWRKECWIAERDPESVFAASSKVGN